MLEILSSRVYYKNTNGGITKRTDEHFQKRIVRYLENGEEKVIEITRDVLGLDATEDEIKQVIMAH